MDNKIKGLGDGPKIPKNRDLGTDLTAHTKKMRKKLDKQQKGSV